MIIVTTVVLAEFKQADFLVLQSKEVINVSSTLFARSGVECAESCLTDDNCTSATYYSSSKHCLLSVDGPENIADIADVTVVTMTKNDLLPSK